MNFITRCLKSKVVPKGFISNLYGKLEKLEKTKTNILNLEATRILHDQFSLNFNNQPADDLNDITSYSVDWTNQAYFTRGNLCHKTLSRRRVEKLVISLACSGSDDACRPGDQLTKIIFVPAR